MICKVLCPSEKMASNLGNNNCCNRLAATVLRTLVTFVIIVGMTRTVEPLPVQSKQDQAMIYLSQYGYLNPALRNPSSGSILSEESWIKAISEFQSFAGLNITGELDDETKKVMTLPRCGVKDRVGYGTTRSKRYALQGSRWKVKNLTFKISKYPKKLARTEVDKELNRAFGVWSTYTDLTFTQKKSGQVHIDIRFERGEHGDGDPFDGPGGTLAHAYFPVYGGDAHFDDSEYWTINSYRGTNLFQVAAHEFGHSLGLSHSDVKSALMAPFYRGYDPVFNLDSDDISGIQALYGKKTRKAPAPSPPKIPDDDDNENDDDFDLSDSKNHRRTTESPNTKYDAMLCADPKVDAMFNSAEGVTYVFKGEYYWKLTKEAVASGYPKLIASGWPGLPGNIDAAFTYKNGKTYFFKGSQYWRYTGKKVDGAYPKDISEGFTGIPDNVDAALVWSGNGKIYFFKGSKFWRFDPSQRPPVKTTYPKPLSNWDGVPDNIDAALHYTNGYTYFFKGGAYYRFNDRMFAVDPADPAFPRSTAYWWFGCPNASKGTIGNAHLTSNEYEHNTDYVEDGGHNSDVSDIILDAADPSDGEVPQNEERVANPEKNTGSSVISTHSIFLPILVLILCWYS